MAAGDLVTTAWQFELRTLLHGEGTSYVIERSGAIRGLVGVGTNMPETEYAHAAGSFAGDAFESARTATFAMEIEGTSATDAGTKYIAMRTAWAPSSSNLPLYFNLPGWGKRYVNGRPLGLVEDMRTADFGLIPVLASFRITDPTIYTP